MKNIEMAKIPFRNKDVPNHPFYLLWNLLGLELCFGRNYQTQIWLEKFYVK